LVLTKAIEKTGETLGEKALEQGGKLMQLLKRKSPDTASAIEVAAQNPELVEHKPEEYSTPVLVEKVQKAAKLDPEIAEAVQSVANAVNAQPQSIQSVTNIAHKIGVVAPGSVFTGDINV
jgi:hypothetical protein